MHYIYTCIMMKLPRPVGKPCIYTQVCSYVFMYEWYAKWDGSSSETSIIQHSEFRFKSHGSVSRNGMYARRIFIFQFYSIHNRRIGLTNNRYNKEIDAYRNVHEQIQHESFKERDTWLQFCNKCLRRGKL